MSDALDSHLKYVITGKLEEKEVPTCYKCGSKMHVRPTADVNLTYLSFGPTFSTARFEKNQYKCPISRMTELGS